MRYLALAVCFVLALPAFAEEHWDIQYRYRQTDSTLTLHDLTFPDSKRGIACGFTTDRKDKDHPLVLFTSDGGQQWTEVPVKESCLALFFLPDATGWMVTDTGIWNSEEGGRSWIKLKSAPPGVIRLWFLDHNHGYAACREKRVYETLDAGVTWTSLPVASSAPGDPVYTTYGDISFSGNMGIISGWNIPPTRGGPDWMETQRTAKPMQVPHLTVLLQTKNGGTTWERSEASLFGQITRISLSPQNVGLGLVEFRDQFDYPSEVYHMNLVNGRNNLAFREKNRAITDIRLFPGSNRALITGYETTGPVYRSPIPGKLKVLTSTDLEHWTEMPVDYRAVAHSAILAGPDDNNAWIATDTGMILKLTP